MRGSDDAGRQYGWARRQRASGRKGSKQGQGRLTDADEGRLRLRGGVDGPERIQRVFLKWARIGVPRERGAAEEQTGEIREACTASHLEGSRESLEEYEETSHRCIAHCRGSEPPAGDQIVQSLLRWFFRFFDQADERPECRMCRIVCAMQRECVRMSVCDLSSDVRRLGELRIN